MPHIKYILLGILPFLTVSTTESKSAGLIGLKDTPLDGKFDSKWGTHELEMLKELANSVLKHSANDFTIVASQNVHNPDGSFKEIKTIELIIPNRFYRGHRLPNQRTDPLDELKTKDEDDYVDIIMKMQQHFKKSYERDDCDVAAAYKRTSEGGDIELELYVSKDGAFYQDDEDGMGYYIKDDIKSNDKKQVEEELKKRFEGRSNDTLISVLLWDADSNFDSKESKVEPRLLAYVDKASDNADEKMMDSAIEALAKVALNSPDRIPKELSAAMSNAYPDYTWFVTSTQDDVTGSAKSDIYIKMTFDNARIGEPTFEYTLYGLKK